VQPTQDEVRQELDRVLRGDGFANADRMSAFLRFVVERALAGEADRVKEYLIGVEVFGRDEKYDPRLDSIVRVEARRLRSKLEEYYAREGQQDPIVIQLRRGGYVPSFERRQPAAVEPPVAAVSTAPAAAARVAPASMKFVVIASILALAAFAGLWAATARPSPGVTVAVLPFSQYSADPADALLAAQLTEGVTTELARIGAVGVASHRSVLQYGHERNPAEIASALHADLLVESSLTKTGGAVRIDARIVGPFVNRKFWVETFEGTTANLPELERRMATALSAAASKAPIVNR
jgi:TolB-like protein